MEEILKRDPDLIIEFDFSAPLGLHHKTAGEEWQPLKEVEALRDNNLFVIGGDYVLIPGPRIIKLAKDFKEIINTISKL